MRQAAQPIAALGLFLISAAPALAQSDACAREATAIGRAESQLPRLEVAPPDDKQIVCITLETNVMFARRLSAHLAQCPRSPHARKAEAWQRIGWQYSEHFSNRRCKPTILPYRG